MKNLLEIFSVPKLLMCQNENILQKTFWQVSDRQLPEPLAACLLTSLNSLFLGNPPGTLLESTKLLAPLPCSLAGSWLTGLLWLEIYNVLCKGNQKNPEECFSQMLWFGLPASGLSISLGPTEPSDLESHQQWRQTACFSQGWTLWWVKWGSLIAQWPKSHLIFLLKAVD